MDFDGMGDLVAEGQGAVAGLQFGTAFSLF
jgi:hypothetical protein